MTTEQLAEIVRAALVAAEKAGLVKIQPGAVALLAQTIGARVAAVRPTLPAPRPAIPDLTPRFHPPLESLSDLPTQTAPKPAPRAPSSDDADDVPTKKSRPSLLTRKP